MAKSEEKVASVENTEVPKLQAELSVVKSENESLKEKVEVLSAELAAVKADNNSLKANAEVLTGEKASLETELSVSEGLVEELQLQLEAAASATEKNGGSIVVTHAKEQYKVVVASFKFRGKEYKAEDLKTDKALVKSLIEASVGFLIKL